MEQKPSRSDAIRGVGVTPVTPFTADLEHVDVSGLESNLEFLVESGVNMLYPAGNTGEALSLSGDEWTQVVETTMEAVGDRAVVMPGIGQEYPVALELARRARSLGVDGLLLMPRSQPYIASRGLVSYWKAIADAAQVPVVVYKKGLPDVSDLGDVLADDAVVACKYADKDVSGFAALVAGDATDIIWTCGIAERYAPFYHQAGATGFTSGLANFAPAPALEMRQSLDAGDYAKALELREACLPFEEIRARDGDSLNVSAVKAAMDMTDLVGGGVRPPLVDLDAEAIVDVKNSLAALGSAVR